MYVKTKFTGYAGKNSIPYPEVQRIVGKCFQCNEPVYFPLITSDFDNRKIVEELEKRFEYLHQDFNALVDELVEMFPLVPIREFMEGRKKEIMKKFHDLLDKEYLEE